MHYIPTMNLTCLTVTIQKIFEYCTTHDISPIFSSFHIHGGIDLESARNPTQLDRGEVVEELQF